MRSGIIGTIWKLQKRHIYEMNYFHQLATKNINNTNTPTGVLTAQAYATNIIESPKVVAFGNVLLDHSAQLENKELLERYKLSLNSRGEIDVETLSQVTTEALGARTDKDPHLGGSSLNTVRILKKLGTEVLFFGAIGSDKQGELVKELLMKSGINSRLQVIPDVPTGRCICLSYENSVALYANIGASSKFSSEYLMKVECEESLNFVEPLERTQIYYIEGFFIPQREEVVTYIVRNYIKGRHILALNLSANYIVKLNYYHIVYLAHHAKIIIGNVDEFEMFRECWGADTFDKFVQELTQNGALMKILIITNGAQGGRIITNYVNENSPPGKLVNTPYEAVPITKVIDTTGCGDAFAGAFLHFWLNNNSLQECTLSASKIAAKVAEQVGCNLP